MRTLMRVTMDTAASNDAIQNGAMTRLINETIDRLKPEAAYFLPEGGQRGCLMIFDLKDVSEIPSIAEPFFLALKAKVNFTPVMNAEELQKGLKTAFKSQFEVA